MKKPKPVFINCAIPEKLKERFLCLLPLKKGRTQTSVVIHELEGWCDKEEKIKGKKK